MQVTQYKKYTRVQIISLYCSHNTNNTQRFVCLFLPISKPHTNVMMTRNSKNISCDTKVCGEFEISEEWFCMKFHLLARTGKQRKADGIVMLGMLWHWSEQCGGKCMCMSVCVCLSTLCRLVSVCVCGEQRQQGCQRV